MFELKKFQTFLNFHFVESKINFYICTRINRRDPWCNGSTSVFGAACRGSNPCGSTKPPDFQVVLLFTAIFTATFAIFS